MRTYRLSVDVELSETLDEEPLQVLASIVLGALNDADVKVTRVSVVLDADS